MILDLALSFQKIPQNCVDKWEARIIIIFFLFLGHYCETKNS